MKQYKNVVLTVFVCLISIVSFGQNNANYIKKVNGETLEITTLNTHIEQLMDSLEMPGLSIAIINDSKLAYHQTFGVSNIETHDKITKTSIFEGASIKQKQLSKYITKLRILQSESV